MYLITIPCHPLSRRVLLTEYGGEPVVIPNHDPLFDLLTTASISRPSARFRSTLRVALENALFQNTQTEKPESAARIAGRLSSELIEVSVVAPLKKPSTRNLVGMTAQITFSFSENIAEAVQANAVSIAERLFREHKSRMCWYAASQVRLRGKGAARPAIADWLELHEVDDQEYSVETAYKCFQRFGWILDKKNPRFSGQLRRKAGVILSSKKRLRAKKNQSLQPLTVRLENVQVELAIGRFLNAHANLFPRMSETMGKHTRIYIYVTMQDLSIREAAQKLGTTKPCVEYACRSIRQRMEKNPTIRRLLEESIALSAQK